ncbi:hypothetical protein A1342_01095 [Methylomonas methanica]|nr:hypothetical protein A1342_01095 [Methylomonas methanica]
MFLPYAAPSIGAFGEIVPQGSGRDAARFRRGRKPLPKTLGKYPQGTRARSAGNRRRSGVFSFGYFSLDKHKFAGSEFEQPTGWPEGRKPGMVFAAKVSRLPVREPALNQVSR